MAQYLTPKDYAKVVTEQHAVLNMTNDQKKYWFGSLHELLPTQAQLFRDFVASSLQRDAGNESESDTDEDEYEN